MKSLLIIVSLITTMSFTSTSDKITESNVDIEVVEKSEMTTFDCIAAGGCKFKFQASCTIEYCSGEREHDDENSTVDKDKLIILPE